MSDQIKSMIIRTVSGFLDAAIAVLVGFSLPQPFGVLAFVAVAIWPVALYWFCWKPGRKEILETIEYLDKLHDHNPRLVSDGDYYRRLNRQLILEGLSSRQLSRWHPKIEVITDKRQGGDDCKAGKQEIVAALILSIFMFFLPIAHGAAWGLCGAGVMPAGLVTVFGSRLSFLLVILVMSIVVWQVLQRSPTQTVCDFVTFLFAGGLLWGFGYLGAFLYYPIISIKPFLISVSLSFFVMSLAGYLPYRRLIDKSLRFWFEMLTLFTGMSFCCVGVMGYVWLFVQPIDLASFQALLLLCLVGFSGFACTWLCSMQWDLILDVVVDSCGEEARCEVLTDRVDKLVQEARAAMGSIIGFLPSYALFCLVLGFCAIMGT